MTMTQSSLQDCYFYFYSSCTKGDECPFRHCKSALGTETVCSLWREGRCFRSNCKFRHMESRINRSMIPCYWENQPGGCRKPHCVFLHRKSRNGVQVIKDNSGLILPTSDGKISPKQLETNETSIVACTLSPNESAMETDVASNPSLIPVPPLVLSFDEGEESDTESVTSTPVKVSAGDKKANLTRNNNLLLETAGSLREKDLGIKTLEQIRMEKIHKESDSYYGAAYTSPPLDAPHLIEQHYPPKSEFLSLPKDSSLDNSSPAPVIEPKLSGVDEENDLRGRLSIKRNTPLNKVNQAKRLINFKKHNINQVEESSNKMDFKIKTLEEIRREKENKLNKSDVAMNNSFGVLNSLEEKKPIKNAQEKTFKKLKIKRKSRESHTVPAVHKNDASNLTVVDMTVAPVVANGIKKMPPRTLEPYETVVLNKTGSNSPGKRKGDDDTCDTASKMPRLGDALISNSEQMNPVNGCSAESDKSYHLQPLQHSRNHSLFSANGSNAISSIQTLTPPNHSQDNISTSRPSVTDIKTNDANASISVSSTSLSHKSEHKVTENVHFSSNEIKSEKTLNCSVLPPSVRSASGIENVSTKDKENYINRSMSVDEDLDELLGDDDMNMDEIDATHSGDILLEIEEFLES